MEGNQTIIMWMKVVNYTSFGDHSNQAYLWLYGEFSRYACGMDCLSETARRSSSYLRVRYIGKYELWYWNVEVFLKEYLCGSSSLLSYSVWSTIFINNTTAVERSFCTGISLKSPPHIATLELTFLNVALPQTAGTSPCYIKQAIRSTTASWKLPI